MSNLSYFKTSGISKKELRKTETNILRIWMDGNPHQLAEVHAVVKDTCHPRIAVRICLGLLASKKLVKKEDIPHPVGRPFFVLNGGC